MFYCAHDPGLALRLTEDQDQTDQTAAAPVFIRIFMIGILAVTVASLGIISLA